ncbi:MAG: 4-(cytidine 5'-diphospho)-2-C-methyl-D-erythritol kinase [Opitutales bacterium]
MHAEAAPAKLNLSLALVGRRPDGFHDLVSLVAPIELADELTFTPDGAWSIACDDPSVPADASNLVLKAAEAYARRRPDCPRGRFFLTKRVPHGAGLGGGSSDAAAALRLLDRASGSPQGADFLEAVAGEVGSDCAFFVRGVPAVMRGRGERLEPLAPGPRRALAGRRVLLIKPPFGVPTPEAYSLFVRYGTLRSPEQAEALLEAWMARPEADPTALGNDLEGPVFRKFIALPVGLESAAAAVRQPFRMTGSGSACFCLTRGEPDVDALRAALRRCWGPGAWVVETRIAS